MGLLDILGSGTPQADTLGQGLLGLGAGLLSGGAYGAFGPALGRGLQGFQQGEQNAQQIIQQGQLNAYRNAQAQMLQQKLNMARRQQAAGLSLLGIGTPTGGLLGVAPPSAPSGGLLGDSGATTYPVSPSGTSAAVGAPGAAPAGFSPTMRQAIGADLVFNGGKGIAGLLKPNVQFQNGYAVNMNNVQPGFSVPTVDASGHATQITRNADGTWGVSAPKGAVSTFRSFQDAQQGAAASHDLVKTVGLDGNTIYQTREQVAQNATGASPTVASRNPITQDSAIKLNSDFVTNDYRPTITAGNSAQEMLSNINAMRSLPITTGWGTDAQAAGARFLAALPGAPDKVQQYASNAQAFNSMALTQVNKVLNAAKGPQTDQDARRAQQTFASLQNTPQANTFILDYAQAAADMQARKAAYYQQMLPMAQKSGDLTRVGREWQKIQGSIWDDPVMNKWRKEQ